MIDLRTCLYVSLYSFTIESGVCCVKSFDEGSDFIKDINGKILKDFISDNYKSVSEFIKDTGLSRSHIYKLFDERVRVGDRTELKLRDVAQKFDFDYKNFYKDEEFKIGDFICRGLIVKDKDNNIVFRIYKDRFESSKDYDYFLQE